MVLMDWLLQLSIPPNPVTFTKPPGMVCPGPLHGVRNLLTVPVSCQSDALAGPHDHITIPKEAKMLDYEVCSFHYQSSCPYYTTLSLSTRHL